MSERSDTPRTVALMARQFDESRKLKDGIPREEIAAAWIDLAFELERELAECRKECEEQARLNGAGASREAALEARLADCRRDAERLSEIRDAVIGNEAWIYDFMTDEHPVNINQFNKALDVVIDAAPAKESDSA